MKREIPLPAIALWPAAPRAYQQAYRAVIDEPGLSDYEIDDDQAEFEGQTAYAEALPPLLGIRNIRACIACVAHGAGTRMLDRAKFSPLLYAAQIALSSCRKVSKKEKPARPSPKKQEKRDSGAIQGPKSATLV